MRGCQRALTAEVFQAYFHPGHRSAKCSAYDGAMSAHYENISQLDTLNDFFKVTAPEVVAERMMRPRRTGGFFRAQALTASATPDSGAQRAQPAAMVAEVPAAAPTTGDPVAAAKKAAPSVVREWVPAQWGLVPHWVKSASDARLRAPKLIEARDDTVSTAQAFREAWLAGQRCVVPLQAFYVDDLRSGKPVPTRIARIDGKPMGVAGVWACWRDPATGLELTSYALLTVNANSHGLLHRYGHPGSEKRMLAVLGEGTYDAWLSARQDKAKEFLRAYPANWLLANPVETKADKKPKDWLS